jgi:hypothetical protein
MKNTQAALEKTIQSKKDKDVVYRKMHELNQLRLDDVVKAFYKLKPNPPTITVPQVQIKILYDRENLPSLMQFHVFVSSQSENSESTRDTPLNLQVWIDGRDLDGTVEEAPQILQSARMRRFILRTANYRQVARRRMIEKRESTLMTI